MTPATGSRTITLGNWTATSEFVAQYLAALETPPTFYSERKLVPPMALAARALGLLIEELGLAPGTVHTSQEVTALKPVKFGQEVHATAKPSRPLRRGSWEFLSVAFTLSELKDGIAGDPVMRGKTTVMSPVEC